MSNRYCVDYTDLAAKGIEELDYISSRLVLLWIDKNLNDCENPEKFGHELTDVEHHVLLARGGRILNKDSKAWCYRIGNYHVMAEINNRLRQILVLALRIDNAANSDDEIDDSF